MPNILAAFGFGESGMTEGIAQIYAKQFYE
jgi:hypothetical protein